MIRFRIVPLGVNAKQPASRGATTSSYVALKVETRALKLGSFSRDSGDST
jgi:hypothetical protein